MKSLKNLRHKLQKINSFISKIKNYPTLDQISVIQFLKLKYFLKQEKRITKEIKMVERFIKGCNLLYKYDTYRWINDPRINCRKYCKLENKARYNRDMKLYKCGVLQKRPMLPIFQKLVDFFQNKEFSNNIFFKIIYKLTSFKLLQKKHKLNINFTKETVVNSVASSQASINEIKGKKFKESLKYNPKSRSLDSREVDIGSIGVGKKRAALDLGCK